MKISNTSLYTDKKRNVVVIENLNDKLNRKIEIEPQIVIQLIGNLGNIRKIKVVKPLKGTGTYIAYDQEKRLLFSGSDYVKVSLTLDDEKQLLSMVNSNLSINLNKPNDYIKSAQLLEMHKYYEPKWTDDNQCIGSPLKDYFGLHGKYDELIEIAINPHERLFDPYDGISTEGYYMSHGFNLYVDGCNIANDKYITLKCTYNIKHNYIKIDLITSKEILYFDKYLTPDKPFTIVEGIIPEKLKHSILMSDLVCDNQHLDGVST